MTYTKQNFEDGQVLTAEHLNKMEEGIAAVSVFGEELGDTLTIAPISSEAEFEALIPELVGGLFLKVCDSPATMEDLANGFTVVIGEDVLEVPPEGVSEMVVPMADGILMFGECFVSVEERGVGVDLDGASFPESGIYAFCDLLYVGGSLTIPNFGKLMGIVPLDAKYIPDTIARKADIVQPDWAQTDETAKDFIKNKPLGVKDISYVVSGSGAYWLISNKDLSNPQRMTKSEFDEILSTYGATNITVGNNVLAGILSNPNYSYSGVYMNRWNNGSWEPIAIFTAEYTV